MAVDQADSASNSQDQFRHEIETELDQAQQTLREVTLMLEQSQVELTKLTQRNANITGHLQQVQAQFDTMPRADIKMAYNSALEAQQRLLVMRGQLEKLQSDHTSLQRYVAMLEKMHQALPESENDGGRHSRGSGSAVLEMVINAQEAERQRLSRLMHDGPAQALSNFIVQAEIAARFLELDPSRAKEEIANLKNAALSTFQKVRTFIFELRPMMLDDLGLIPTVRRYVDTFKEQSGVEVNLTVKGTERRLEPYLEAMIFRALQELMGNTVKHNQDTPVKLQLGVQVTLEETLVKVVVSDNGKGFNPAAAKDSEGFGLRLIRERVEMLGGFMDIDAAVGQGSRVSFQVPCLDAIAPATQS